MSSTATQPDFGEVDRAALAVTSASSFEHGILQMYTTATGPQTLSDIKFSSDVDKQLMLHCTSPPLLGEKPFPF